MAPGIGSATGSASYRVPLAGSSVDVGAEQPGHDLAQVAHRHQAPDVFVGHEHAVAVLKRLHDVQQAEAVDPEILLQPQASTEVGVDGGAGLGESGADGGVVAGCSHLATVPAVAATTRRRRRLACRSPAVATKRAAPVGVVRWASKSSISSAQASQ